MNTSSLKSFAPAVRRQLMEAVGRKLDYVLTADTPDLRQAAAQVASLRKEAAKHRAALIERVAYTWFNRLAALRFLDAQGWHPFKARVLTPATPEETQPEVLKLLRTGSLPAELHSHTDLLRLNDLLDGRLPTAIAGADPQGEAYRGLILAACRLYHTLLPDVFDKLNDESELLLPDDLLTATSVAEGFRTEITDADCLETDAAGKSRANVEILGWLYQFYISEKKDAVMARKSAVPTEDIPAVTQLFTPHWIVRYLVENSLGRLWLNSRPNSRLRDHMPYFIEDANSVPSDQCRVISGEENTPPPSTAPSDLFSSTDHRSPITDHSNLFSSTDHRSPITDHSDLTVGSPKDIRLVDPAVGSGHMLTYAFDLLVKIYEEEGYAPSEIPALILRHNLHGLEICPRAAQLAELALVFKAREKSRRFFQPDHLVRPNITELQDIRFDEDELQAYFKALDLNPSSFGIPHSSFLSLLHQFEEAKNFGSLIQPCLSETEVQSVRSAIQNSKSIIQNSDLMVGATHLKVLRVLEQAEALTQRYHVVVANPPYLGNKGQNGRLKQFLEEHFDGYNTDLFAAFIVRGSSLALKSGLLGFMAPNVWMFLSTHNALRDLILNSLALNSLVELPLSGFTGATVQVCAFILEARRKKDHQATFIRLCDFRGAGQMDERTLEAIGDSNCSWVHKAVPDDFAQIPGSPIAYWVSPRIRAIFANATATFEDVATPRQGLGTGENSRFTRLWSEVPFGKIGFGSSDSRQAMASLKKWFPYTKGGGYRKWTGNEFDVVNWEQDGKEIREALVGKNPNIPRSEKHYFREGITWGLITSAEFSARYVEPGAIFDVGGSKAFPDSRQRASMLGLLNSKLTALFLKSLNPTLNFQVGDLKRIPIVNFEGIRPEVDKVIGQTIQLSEADWDNFETSWDFRDQPLLRPGLKGATLEASWRNWEAQSTAAIRRMQELETENNRLFIASYGLEGELQPEVPEDQITLARADRRKDIAAFLSYAVGCMMGRYSLDAPGLILANAGDAVEDYLRTVSEKRANPEVRDQESGISKNRPSSADSKPNPDPCPPSPDPCPPSPDPRPLTPEFPPDADGIIPILDGDWFTDDAVARTREFLRVTFGEATLKQNLRFIEDSLGKPLEKYFLTDFYRDHLQTYKKRPIYWLFQSPKKGFSALVYLHRYTKDTVNTLLNRYLRDYLKKLESRIAHLTQVEATATATKEKTAARKEREKLQKALKDCQDWERDTILPLAQQRLEIDLDDGVKANYPKFTGAVQPIPGLAAKED